METLSGIHEVRVRDWSQREGSLEHYYHGTSGNKQSRGTTGNGYERKAVQFVSFPFIFTGAGGKRLGKHNILLTGFQEVPTMGGGEKRGEARTSVPLSLRLRWLPWCDGISSGVLAPPTCPVLRFWRHRLFLLSFQPQGWKPLPAEANLRVVLTSKVLLSALPSNNLLW